MVFKRIVPKQELICPDLENTVEMFGIGVTGSILHTSNQMKTKKAYVDHPKNSRPDIALCPVNVKIGSLHGLRVLGQAGARLSYGFHFATRKYGGS